MILSVQNNLCILKRNVIYSISKARLYYYRWSKKLFLNSETMKTINFKLSMMLVMVSTLFISCNSNEPVDTAILANQQVSKELKSSYNLLDITPNVYHDYFKKTDFSAGFSSLKDNSLAQPSVVQLNDIDSKVKTLSYTVNGGSKTQLSKSSKLSGADSQSIYGKTISFKINNSST